jgi:hypothetical protein
MLNNFEFYLGCYICDTVGRNETVDEWLAGFIEIVREERY